MDDISEETIEEIERLIWLKKITICETCDNIFPYVPQKKFCDECRRARAREYYEENREKINARHRKWREKNREKVSARERKYYEKNREEIKARHRKYREENREKLSAQRRALYHAKKEK